LAWREKLGKVCQTLQILLVASMIWILDGIQDGLKETHRVALLVSQSLDNRKS
jgi:hypothetical protein